MARRSAWIEPVSLMAIVPVALCSCPTMTSVSVTASPVVSTCGVARESAAALSARAMMTAANSTVVA
jgi:hypothetical protein